MAENRWALEQLKLAFHLYCQLPFGKLHQRQPDIIALAELIGRSPGAVAFKLVNFASLDPDITASGRVGMRNHSALDREVWDAFHADWEGLAAECDAIRARLEAERGIEASIPPEVSDGLLDDYTGEVRQVMTAQRVRQQFFRKAVLASYRGQCCMSGLCEPRLLVASHIVPWKADAKNRLNPRNGLCLSAIHDKAFDQGLISLTDDFRVLISEEMRKLKGSFVEHAFGAIEGKSIVLPERFAPEPSFIAHHRESIFFDNRAA
ncbi:MAG: HNH endonuclease [Zoogloeaceae bacterium]|nr:HNH endonuclease [Zoogloeaceae bacterium]